MTPEQHTQDAAGTIQAAIASVLAQREAAALPRIRVVTCIEVLLDGGLRPATFVFNGDDLEAALSLLDHCADPDNLTGEVGPAPARM